MLYIVYNICFASAKYSIAAQDKKKKLKKNIKLQNNTNVWLEVLQLHLRWTVNAMWLSYNATVGEMVSNESNSLQLNATLFTSVGGTGSAPWTESYTVIGSTIPRQGLE